MDICSLLNGAVVLIRTEIDRDYRLNGKIIHNIEYEFQFNEPGTYLFEGWVKRYRATEMKTEEWHFDIDRTPIIELVPVNSLVYRL